MADSVIPVCKSNLSSVRQGHAEHIFCKDVVLSRVALSLLLVISTSTSVCRDSHGVAMARPPGQSDAEAIRVRCRLTVLMQRTCDLIHRTNAQHMPVSVQLQLLSVLQVRHLIIHPLLKALTSTECDKLFYGVRSCTRDLYIIGVSCMSS